MGKSTFVVLATMLAMLVGIGAPWPTPNSSPQTRTQMGGIVPDLAVTCQLEAMKEAQKQQKEASTETPQETEAQTEPPPHMQPTNPNSPWKAAMEEIELITDGSGVASAGVAGSLPDSIGQGTAGPRSGSSKGAGGGSEEETVAPSTMVDVKAKQVTAVSNHIFHQPVAPDP